MRARELLGLAVLLGVAWISPSAEGAEPAPAPTFQLTSPAFAPQTTIPRQYTCQGQNLSPPLAWQGVPAGTRSLALVVDDPDAPDPASPKMVWDHWVLYDLPPEPAALPVGAGNPPPPGAGTGTPRLPEGARPGKTSWKKTAWGGPCPPKGRHRYFFRLYALDVILPDLKEPTKAELLKAMQGHVLGQAELIGLYQKVQ